MSLLIVACVIICYHIPPQFQLLVLQGSMSARNIFLSKHVDIVFDMEELFASPKGEIL